MDRRYKEGLDRLRFTQEEKRDMVEYLLDAHKEEPKVRAYHKKFKFIMIGVAAALALTAGAGAVIGGNASDWLSGVFGGGHTEIIDRIGRPVGASASGNGLKVTADAIIGDSHNACIVYTIEREDGTPFDFKPNEFGYLPLHFQSQWTDLNVLGGSHGSAWFTDNDPGDNKIQFVEVKSADVPLGGRAKAEFHDLCYFNEETGESEPLVEGDWKLRFNVDYEDASVQVPAGQAFTQDGMGFTVTGISLSPVALRVEYEVDSQADWGDAESADGRMPEDMRRQQARYFEDVPLLIHLKDGTVIDQTRAGGGIRPKGGKTYCTKGDVFERIVPVEDVQSLTVGSVEIPVQ
ncbi:DUF4179 domain-containing protein [Intestinibacillus massiliensis]|nr:DUF4179 domain-containing protein [Intestinibacillus massiliensis]